MHHRLDMVNNVGYSQTERHDHSTLHMPPPTSAHLVERERSPTGMRK